MGLAREHFDLVAVGGTGYGNVYRRIEKQNASTQYNAQRV
jgi:hypothetical protein